MINLNIKNDEEKVTAEYLLKSSDRIDNLTLGMMVNNKIDGVIPIQPIQMEDDRFFRYDITDKITMKKYLGDFIKKEHILKAFYGIATTIKESTEYMINWTSFSLDTKEIYIDEATGKVSLICIPLLTVINDGNTCNFFKNVLFSSQFDLDENGDYVGKLITFLNPKSYTIDKFIYELEEMLEIDHAPEIIEDEEELEDEVETIENDEEVISDETVPEEKTVEETVVEEKSEDTIEEVATEKSAEEETETEDKSETEEESEEEKSLEPTYERPEIAPYLIKSSNNQIINIDKDKFYIGKDEPNVDYCVAGNSAVDEKHAYIIRHGKEYFVVDNKSKNHTYMNRVLIAADEEVFIPHGAHLRFADEDFEFRMHK